MCFECVAVFGVLEVFESGFPDGVVFIWDDFPGEYPWRLPAVIIAGSGSDSFVDTEFDGFRDELEIDFGVLAVLFKFFEEVDGGLEVVLFVFVCEVRAEGPVCCGFKCSEIGGDVGRRVLDFGSEVTVLEGLIEDESFLPVG